MKADCIYNERSFYFCPDITVSVIIAFSDKMNIIDSNVVFQNFQHTGYFDTGVKPELHVCNNISD